MFALLVFFAAAGSIGSSATWNVAVVLVGLGLEGDALCVGVLFDRPFAENMSVRGYACLLVVLLRDEGHSLLEPPMGSASLLSWGSSHVISQEF